MALLTILTVPHPFLKTHAKAVVRFDEELRKLAGDMIETMYENRGIGLAATQVGDNKRLFVMDTQRDVEGEEIQSNPLVVINPEIISQEGEQIMEEGCLSVPEVREEVKRCALISLRYQDMDGQFHEMDAQELKSVCIQHEMDHLNGILFIDYLSPLKRRILLKKLKKQSNQKQK